MKDLRKIHTENPKNSDLRMVLVAGVGGNTIRRLAYYTPCWGKWYLQDDVTEVNVLSWLDIFDPKEQGVDSE